MIILYASLLLMFYLYKGLIIITLVTLIFGAYTFVTSFTYLYLLETGDIRKIAIATTIPLLYVHLIRFIHEMFIDNFSEPNSVGKFITGTLYLTIGYIPFGIILFILNCSEKRKVT
jgi:hypothetical protein